MRILAIFITLAAVTITAYIFSFLSTLAIQIAKVGGMSDYYKQAHDAISFDAVAFAIYTALSLMAALGVYKFIQWMGEILSG